MFIVGILLLTFSGCMTEVSSPLPINLNSQTNSDYPYPNNYQELIKDYAKGHRIFLNIDDWKIVVPPKLALVNLSLVKNGLLGAGFGSVVCYEVVFENEKASNKNYRIYGDPKFFHFYIKDGNILGWTAQFKKD